MEELSPKVHRVNLPTVFSANSSRTLTSPRIPDAASTQGERIIQSPAD